MLADITLQKEIEEPILRAIMALADGGVTKAPEKIGVGMYLGTNWNFHSLLNCTYQKSPEFKEQVGYIPAYGVCDYPQQVVSKFPGLATSENKYVISFVKVSKYEEPSTGGWRWHKWGEYIGGGSPQCEYIYDEPILDIVYTFHIYEVFPVTRLTAEEITRLDEERLEDERKETIRQHIFNIIEDGVSDMWYYSRKEDEDMPVGSIEEAVKEGIITIDEMVEYFRDGITK